MIIKRTMKIEMPNLKRCKLEEQDGEDYGCALVPKKRKVNGFCSLGMPGEAEDFSSGSGSWCSEGSYWASEVLSNSNSTPLNSRTTMEQGSERIRPPLLRSSRGRSQTLPSRFNDSVLGTWKNRGIKVEDADSSFEDDNILVEDGAGVSGLGFVKQGKGNNYGSKKSKYDTYPSMDGEESVFDDSGLNNFDHRKLTNSFSTTRTSINGNRSSAVKTESFTSGLSFEGVDQKLEQNAAKR